METKTNGLKAQLQRNSIALVSIIIAIASLSYNTWRNEHTEHNRNIRSASFDVLKKLNDLKELVYLGHYDHDMQRGNPRIGWAYVITIQDLSLVLPEPLPQQANHLVEVWENNWEGIGKNQNSVNEIDESIDKVRDSTVQLIKSLH